LSVVRFVAGPPTCIVQEFKQPEVPDMKYVLTAKTACWEIHLPVACSVYFMEIFATLLAKIFLGGALSAKDADTGAVLPDLANVALNEEAGNVFSKFYGIEEI
jgi:hypothetical protein